jgi:hypothetical protein
LAIDSKGLFLIASGGKTYTYSVSIDPVTGSISSNNRSSAFSDYTTSAIGKCVIDDSGLFVWVANNFSSTQTNLSVHHIENFNIGVGRVQGRLYVGNVSSIYSSHLSGLTFNNNYYSFEPGSSTADANGNSVGAIGLLAYGATTGNQVWLSAARKVGLFVTDNAADPSGNYVGINNSSPISTLEVSGNWKLGTIENPSAQSGSNYWGGLGGGMNAGNNIYSMYFRDRTDAYWNTAYIEANDLHLRTNSYTTSTAVTAGSFIVGMKYQVASVGSISDWSTFGGPNPATVGTIFTATGVGSGTGTAYDIRQGGATTKMIITNAGNVGIGTNNPTVKLHVADNVGNTGAIQAILENTSTNGTAVLTVKTAGASMYSGLALAGGGTYIFFNNEANNTENARISAAGSNGLWFSTGSSATERMRITSSGNVGIGTSSPNVKLHLYESAETANFLRLENSLGSTYLGTMRTVRLN